MVSKFSGVRFWPFLALIGPFLVIFLVLEGSHSVTFLPKYAPGSGLHWEKRKFAGTSKMSLCQQLLYRELSEMIIALQ